MTNQATPAAHTVQPRYKNLAKKVTAQQDFTKWIMELRHKQLTGKLHFNWDPAAGDGINCLTLASGAVEAQTGINLYKELAGSQTYNSPVSAGRVLLSLGYPSLEALLDSLFMVKPRTLLVRGDLALAKSVAGTAGEGGGRVEVGVESLGVVVIDPPFYWAATPSGLGRGLRNDIVKGYHVGDLIKIVGPPGKKKA